MTDQFGQQSQSKSWGQTIFLASVLLLSVFLFTFNLYKYYSRSNSVADFNLGRVLYYIDQYHIDEISDQDKILGLLEGIASKLGPHARAFPPADLTKRMDDNNNLFVGVGVSLRNINGELVVVYAIEDSGAFDAGIKSGDVLYKVDGKLVEDLSSEEVVNALKGEANTSVNIEVRRAGSSEPLPFDIVRSAVKRTSIAYAQLLPDGKTGYVGLEDFASETATDLTEKIVDLQATGMTQLVIDLRHNGGGLLRSAVAVANLFMSDVPVVTVRSGKQDKPSDEVFLCNGDTMFPDLPVSILIDGLSASASEILAAAMQEHKRATIVGMKSYGKGTVQRTFSEGLNGYGIKFTTALFYTPNGVKIQGTGVTPDILAEETRDDYVLDLVYHDAMKVRKYIANYEPQIADLEYPWTEIKDKVLDAAIAGFIKAEKQAIEASVENAPVQTEENK